MTATAILTSLRACGASVAVDGDRLRIDAPKGSVPPELKASVQAHKDELVRLLRSPLDPGGAAEIGAVLIRSTALGESAWLVPNSAALMDCPDIAASGLPIFFFDEVDKLASLPPEELRTVAMLKRVFPGSRIVQ